MRPTLPFFFLLSLLILSGCTEAPAPTDESCCTVDDVVRMSKEGVAQEIIIKAIVSSGSQQELSANQMIELTNAKVAPEVIDALMGGERVTAATEAEEPAGAPEQKPKPPTLKVSVEYERGAKSMVVRSLSSRDYTNVVLKANGEYEYRLPPGLKSNSSDRVRLSSLKSNQSGRSLDDDVGIRTLTVRSDQGVWSKSF